MQRFAHLLISLRWPLAAIGMVCLFVCYSTSTRLAMDRRIASLFAPEDPTFVDYQEFKHAFGENEVIIVMYRDDDLATTSGMQRNRDFSDQLKALPDVSAVLSPSVLNESARVMNPANLLRSGDEVPPLMRKGDPVAEGLDGIFSGYTHAKDYRYAAVVVMIPRLASTRNNTPTEIRRIADQWAENASVSELSVVGEPVLIQDAFDLIQRDGDRLAIWTIALLSFVLLITLMDLRFIAIAGLTIIWSIVVTKAVMVWLGVSLSLIASILTAIVTVIAVASVLHLGVRFHRKRFRSESPKNAARRALEGLTAPVAWTCLTDAAGFAALIGSQILPVKQFGLMIALSATCVLVSLLLFAPAIMTLPSFGFGAAAHRRKLTLNRWLRRLGHRVAFVFVAARHIAVVAALLVAAVAVWIVLGGESETSFLNNFRQESRITIDYGRVEKNLGGVGVWDIVLDAPVEIDQAYVDRVLALENDLRKINVDGAKITKAISAADAIDVIGRAPTFSIMPAALRLAALRERLPAFINALVSDPQTNGQRKFRIMLRSPEDLETDQKKRLIDLVNETTSKHLKAWAERDDGKPTGIVTGYYVIMARLVDQLLSDQWRCFGWSVVFIWLLMLLATRKLTYATAALLPNLLPVFLVLAIVAIAGEKTNMGAAMIAAVSIGLSIDGSVHFLAGYGKKRKRGVAQVRAACSAASAIGAPVILATIALVIGFSVLSTSEFIPTATFGILVAATMVAGTIVNLTLLPALVVMLDRRIRSKNS